MTDVFLSISALAIFATGATFIACQRALHSRIAELERQLEDARRNDFRDSNGRFARRP